MSSGIVFDFISRFIERNPELPFTRFYLLDKDEQHLEGQLIYESNKNHGDHNHPKYLQLIFNEKTGAYEGSEEIW